MIDDVDKKIIGLVQGDMPLDPKPFAGMAEEIGISEDEFVERVRSLKKGGIIRRFGATLRHQEAGFSSNAMVAWIIPDNRIGEVGKILASFREVSHCYQRQPQKDLKFNLYTMIHGEDREACLATARKMSEHIGIDSYTLMFSEKEFKKTSMEYF